MKLEQILTLALINAVTQGVTSSFARYRDLPDKHEVVFKKTTSTILTSKKGV